MSFPDPQITIHAASTSSARDNTMPDLAIRLHGTHASSDHLHLNAETLLNRSALEPTSSPGMVVDRDAPCTLTCSAICTHTSIWLHEVVWDGPHLGTLLRVDLRLSNISLV